MDKAGASRAGMRARKKEIQGQEWDSHKKVCLIQQREKVNFLRLLGLSLYSLPLG